MPVVKVKGPPDDRNVFFQVGGYFTEILKGMRITIGIFFRQLLRLEKTNTLEWPEQPADYGNRFKGKHFLTLRDDGEIRCTACFLCATACPADCIHIEAASHPDNSIEKYPTRFEIDILRCVFCGMCEEACPVDAIRLGGEHTMAGLAGEKWVYTKDYLAQRPALEGGVTSVKDENSKHPTIDHEPDGDERSTHLHFGIH